MNYELLQEHINRSIVLDFVPELKADGSNSKDFFAIDSVSVKKFAQNYGGYPRSDIAEINEQSNVMIQAEMLSRLQQLPVSDSNSGLSDQEIMLQHRSKYCQTAGEQISWLEELIKYRDAQRLESTNVEDGKIDFSDNKIDDVNE